MDQQQYIIVKGAKEHNLKNVTVKIPKNKLVVLTGLSGSGKSSFAFDTLYAEGQRRYVESLSSYARQFLGIMKKPDVESIVGLSPAISIDQKTVSHNPRSTVGTITEIYDYLRLLFARIGHPHCPNCGIEIAQQSVDQIYQQVTELARRKFYDPELKHKGLRMYIMSPVIRGRKGEYTNLLETMKQKGYQRARIDGHVIELSEDINLLKNNKHNIEAIVDRIVLTFADLESDASRTRMIEALESSLRLSDGLAMVTFIGDDSLEFPVKPKVFEDHLFSERFACPECNLTLPEVEPRLFSFNTPHGACPVCNGLGELKKIDKDSILNPRLTISEGGILPFNRMLESGTSMFFNLMNEVAKDRGFSLTEDIGEMKPEHVEVVLYGTGEKRYEVEGVRSDGRAYKWPMKFEGVINNLERRYLETKSDFMRGEIEKYMRKEECSKCHGTRLKEESLAVVVDGKNISQVTHMSIRDSYAWTLRLAGRRSFADAQDDTMDAQDDTGDTHNVTGGCQDDDSNVLSEIRDVRNATVLSETIVDETQAPLLSKKEMIIAAPILKELDSRLGFLLSVGLDYLDLARSANTLAGGESQRIRLASQIGSGLSGVLYVLDEPSIGLHQRDNHRLIDTLKNLRDLGNTVVVVEHDMDMMNEADYIVDFGPLAGEFGGEVVAEGTPEEIARDDNSLTGKYLSGKKQIRITPATDNQEQQYLEITGCNSHNLKNISVKFPLGKLICITGLSGSGKSTLIDDTLYHALAKSFSPRHKEVGGEYQELKGVEHLKRVAMIDQSPIGRTPRSNPATYTKTFDHIRDLFTMTGEAKLRGYKAGRFSFNVKGGRCEACQGEGQIKIEMQFLPDVYVDCEVCKGERYNYETLQVHYKGKNIAEVLNMTVEESLKFFKHNYQIQNKLQTLYDVGLGYVRLGQPAPTLSGGEAQRIKLGAELSKVGSTNTIYLLDEPTTGLHFADLEKLLLVLKRLVEKGNTILVIEHNLDLIKNADWILDLGPEGGNGGGEIVAMGSPKAVAAVSESWTGRFLQKVL